MARAWNFQGIQLNSMSSFKFWDQINRFCVESNRLLFILFEPAVQGFFPSFEISWGQIPLIDSSISFDHKIAPTASFCKWIAGYQSRMTATFERNLHLTWRTALKFSFAFQKFLPHTELDDSELSDNVTCHLQKSRILQNTIQWNEHCGNLWFLAVRLAQAVPMKLCPRPVTLVFIGNNLVWQILDKGQMKTNVLGRLEKGNSTENLGIWQSEGKRCSKSSDHSIHNGR